MFLIHYLGKDHQVYAVKTPQEAAEWLRGESVDLIVSDYPANPILGVQVRALRAAADSRRIPILMLTDQDKSEQRINAFQWGAKDCISKPFNPVELKMRVQMNLPLMGVSTQANLA
jgi:DNA-binding response OmpR family regulator